MDNRGLAVIGGVLGLVIVMILFQPVSNADIPNDLFCESDVDCVSAEDCHPTTCVSAEYKLHSEEPTFCTTDCVADTMDCGQGSCKCMNNNCEAVINE